MPQGVIRSVSPIVGTEPCTGSVEALEDDKAMGIVKGQLYPYKAGRGKCCKEEEFVQIRRLKPDGSVKLECTDDLDEEI